MKPNYTKVEGVFWDERQNLPVFVTINQRLFKPYVRVGHGNCWEMYWKEDRRREKGILYFRKKVKNK